MNQTNLMEFKKEGGIKMIATELSNSGIVFLKKGGRYDKGICL